MSKTLSDIITEFVWKAAHNNPSYGIKELKVIQGMHPNSGYDNFEKDCATCTENPQDSGLGYN